MTKRTCSVNGCDRDASVKSWCRMHYMRWYRHGDPEHPDFKIRDPEESFRRRTEQQGDCLVWTGTLNNHGYGSISVKGREVMAHRYAWERANGPIPDGMDIDHRCNNPSCCRVSHLRVATRKQNMENRRSPAGNNTSGYIGVYKNKRTGRWFVKVKHYGKQHYGGTFDSPEEANDSAKALRNRLFTHNDRDRAA